MVSLSPTLRTLPQLNHSLSKTAMSTVKPAAALRFLDFVNASPEPYHAVHESVVRA